mmetsp:Transcript_5782/g.10995  ORF Transcript_5782/g.10995 Transcript_5782/m.10995 type:complete len:324 (+) Transcript_5782:766-1737(+)
MSEWQKRLKWLLNTIMDDDGNTPCQDGLGQMKACCCGRTCRCKAEPGVLVLEEAFLRCWELCTVVYVVPSSAAKELLENCCLHVFAFRIPHGSLRIRHYFVRKRQLMQRAVTQSTLLDLHLHLHGLVLNALRVPVLFEAPRRPCKAFRKQQGCGVQVWDHKVLTRAVAAQLRRGVPVGREHGHVLQPPREWRGAPIRSEAAQPTQTGQSQHVPVPSAGLVPKGEVLGDVLKSFRYARLGLLGWDVRERYRHEVQVCRALRHAVSAAEQALVKHLHVELGLGSTHQRRTGKSVRIEPRRQLVDVNRRVLGLCWRLVPQQHLALR